MITFGVHQSSPIAAKNEENRRSGVFEYVCQCMVWANCTQFQKKEGLLGWVERALTALPFIAALSFIQTHKGCVRGEEEGPLFVFPATEKVPGESGCVSDLMSYPGSAPRAPSNFTAWESSGDSALLSRPEETRLQHPGSVSLSVSASFSFFLKYVLSLCGVFKHTQIHTHTPCATWFELNRRQGETESTGSNNLLQNSARWHCLVRQTAREKRWVWDDPALAQWLPTEPPSQPNFQLGLSSLGSVLRLDTACHQQARANEIRARLITALRPQSPLVISWVNDQGPVTLGWA